MERLLWVGLLPLVLAFQFEAQYQWNALIANRLDNNILSTAAVTSANLSLALLDVDGVRVRLALSILDNADTTKSSCYYLFWGMPNASSFGTLTDGLHFSLTGGTAPPLNQFFDLQAATSGTLHTILVDQATDPLQWTFTASDSISKQSNQYYIDLSKEYRALSPRDISLPSPVDPPLNLLLCRYYATGACPGFSLSPPFTGTKTYFNLDSSCRLFTDFKPLPARPFIPSLSLASASLPLLALLFAPFLN